MNATTDFSLFPDFNSGNNGYNTGEAQGRNFLNTNPTQATNLQVPGSSIPNGNGQGSWSLFDQMGDDGNVAQKGVLGDIAGGVGSAFNIYTALKGLGLAEDQFKFNKESYFEQRDAQYQDYDNRQSKAANRRAGAKSDDFLRVQDYESRDAAEAAYVESEVAKNSVRQG